MLWAIAVDNATTMSQATALPGRVSYLPSNEGPRSKSVDLTLGTHACLHTVQTHVGHPGEG